MKLAVFGIYTEIEIDLDETPKVFEKFSEVLGECKAIKGHYIVSVHESKNPRLRSDLLPTLRRPSLSGKNKTVKM